ncbi:unnamed protein product [Caenorhabditis bovis]|uniref:Hflx-type G domain-containing protein n=1 Tax=Caenorhabditis bovis TaxID=2654633 RepID=A0A8S1E2A5_9PELO|nr:unnamed protein product [Caenorhabditis bovis]
MEPTNRLGAVQLQNRLDSLIFGYLHRMGYIKSSEALTNESAYLSSADRKVQMGGQMAFSINDRVHDRTLEEIILLFIEYGRFGISPDLLAISSELRQLSFRLTNLTCLPAVNRSENHQKIYGKATVSRHMQPTALVGDQYNPQRGNFQTFIVQENQSNPSAISYNDHMDEMEDDEKREVGSARRKPHAPQNFNAKVRETLIEPIVEIINEKPWDSVSDIHIDDTSIFSNLDVIGKDFLATFDYAPEMESMQHDQRLTLGYNPVQNDSFDANMMQIENEIVVNTCNEPIPETTYPPPNDILNGSSEVRSLKNITEVPAALPPHPQPPANELHQKLTHFADPQPLLSPIQPIRVKPLSAEKKNRVNSPVEADRADKHKSKERKREKSKERDEKKDGRRTSESRRNSSDLESTRDSRSSRNIDLSPKVRDRNRDFDKDRKSKLSRDREEIAERKPVEDSPSTSNFNKETSPKPAFDPKLKATFLMNKYRNQNKTIPVKIDMNLKTSVAAPVDLLGSIDKEMQSFEKKTADEISIRNKKQPNASTWKIPKKNAAGASPATSKPLPPASSSSSSYQSSTKAENSPPTPFRSNQPPREIQLKKERAREFELCDGDNRKDTTAFIDAKMSLIRLTAMLVNCDKDYRNMQRELNYKNNQKNLKTDCDRQDGDSSSEESVAEQYNTSIVNTHPKTVKYAPQKVNSFKTQQMIALSDDDEGELKDESDNNDGDDDDESDSEIVENVSTPHTSKFREGLSVLVVHPKVRWGSGSASVLKNAERQLEEAVSLVDNLPHMRAVDSVILPVDYNTKRKTIWATGNIEKLIERKEQARATALMINVDVLSPTQQEELFRLFEVPIFDRYNIVLSIFKEYAQTEEARLQISLAELPYIKSRIHALSSKRLNSRPEILHIDPRFSELEGVDLNEMLRKREQELRKELREVIRKNDDVAVKTSVAHDAVVAIVGYTNAGKTSLVKKLTGADELDPKDRLFATLDTSRHCARLPSGRYALFTDTIGFFSDLPIHLIAAFEATLAHVKIANVIIHLRDIANPDWRAQEEDVLATLKSIGVDKNILETRVITVDNKIDKDNAAHVSDTGNKIRISCKTGEGMNDLVQLIDKKVVEATDCKTIRLRLDVRSPIIEYLYRNEFVVAEPKEKDNTLIFDVVVLRRLPKAMTEEEMLEQISPLPEEVIHTFFMPADLSLEPFAFSSMYLVFSQFCDSLLEFEKRFDGYIFVDSKGNDSIAMVEAATNQSYAVFDREAIKKDSRCGTNEQSPYYKDFIKKIEEEASIPIKTVEQQLKMLGMGDDTKTKIEKLETPLVRHILEKEYKKRDRRRLYDRTVQRAPDSPKKEIKDMAKADARPFLALEIKCNLVGITDLKPNEPETFRWHLKMKCTNCGEAPEHWQYIVAHELLEIPGSRGHANVVEKCKLSIIPDSFKSYSIDKNEKWQPLVTFDCRGIEPYDFDPRNDWVAAWADYDEKAGESVEISEITSQFSHVKDPKKK